MAAHQHHNLLLAFLLTAILSIRSAHALRRAPAGSARRLRQQALQADDAIALAAAEKQQRTLVVFGDSLSDTGNLLSITHGVLPSRKVYWRGRFSDGPNWVDDIAADPRVTTTVHNYAVGGATACRAGGISALPDLRAQIDLFLSGAPGARRQASQPGTASAPSPPPPPRTAHPVANPNLLIVVWIGHNDFLLSPEGMDVTPQQAAQLIRNLTACWEAGLDHLLTVLELHAAAAAAASAAVVPLAVTSANGAGGGAIAAAPLAREWQILKGGSSGDVTGAAAPQQKVVVWSLAPVEIAPGVEPQLKPVVREVVVQANAALLDSIDSLRARHPGVVLDIFDAHATISDSFAVARTVLGFQNDTGPCLAPPPVQSQQALSMGGGGGGELLGSSQDTRCPNPAEYVWYDELHPTSRAQRLTVAKPFREFLVAKRR